MTNNSSFVAFLWEPFYLHSTSIRVKTQRCLSIISFPHDWNITHSDNYGSNVIQHTERILPHMSQINNKSSNSHLFILHRNFIRILYRPRDRGCHKDT